MNWIDRLERKYRRYAIRDLMKYIVAITGLVFILSFLNPAFIYNLTLNPDLIMQGQVWRLVSYVFIPPSTSPIFGIIALYFYYWIGSTLESEWGSFRFNLYYFIGMIGTTIGVLLTGGIGTSTYLYMSLFLAFAYVYPNYQILLFFIIPVKMKYLAWLDLALIALAILTQPLPHKVAAVVSIANYFLFFGKGMFSSTKSGTTAYYKKKKYQSQFDAVKPLVHRCRVCGLTQDDNPKMDFRYCPECDGRQAYCTEHIRNHEHYKEKKVIDFPGNKKD
jgi:hypothetical protein